ncbi:hypothetical protein VTK73DRAFT_3168 [Phialemonium thermophilum]|uniref:Uncharacterized protein n=1 Tax=Phialemonium thermophilum TaxID=223376 RepID=A0ABR3VLB0_9PEZI
MAVWGLYTLESSSLSHCKPSEVSALEPSGNLTCCSFVRVVDLNHHNSTLPLCLCVTWSDVAVPDSDLNFVPVFLSRAVFLKGPCDSSSSIGNNVTGRDKLSTATGRRLAHPKAEPCRHGEPLSFSWGTLCPWCHDRQWSVCRTRIERRPKTMPLHLAAR